LCESNEACSYAPNFAAYQGHGGIATCVSTNGVAVGVQVVGFIANGV
jgi:hypothetical protein